MVTKIIDPTFETFGWKARLQKKRGTSKITINKVVAVGACLETLSHLYCYLARDQNNRSIVVVYLDGEPRDNI